jgi:glycine/D-amino acid oxidase-like deaminating enzyme
MSLMRKRQATGAVGHDESNPVSRGLARAVERHGGAIYEETRVLDYVPGPLPRLDTARGNVSAKAIVLAGEAYLSQLPKLHRQIMPMTSHLPSGSRRRCTGPV